MGLFDIFRKKDDDEELAIDPLRDLVLEKLQVGFLVDHDLETWKVTAYNRYDFDGDEVEEWELTTGRKKRYLERSEDDEEVWALSEKVPVGALESAEGSVRQYTIEHEDPPEQITYQGETYYLDEMAAGHLYPDGEGPRRELIKWDFVDGSGESFVTLEQWGETDFEAAAGKEVAPYEFTNILPPEGG